MTKTRLLRLGGLAAVVAGVLRIGAALVPTTAPAAPREWLYLIIDVSIMFGLVAVYAYQHAESGLWGLIGFALTVAGTESIGGPDGKIGDLDIYTAGATVIGVGAVFLGVGSWRARKLPRYVPVLWILSTAVGMTSFLTATSPVPYLIAGIAFGLGFIGAGLRLWTDPALKPVGDAP